MAKYWAMSLGEAGKYAELIDKNQIAIGWEELGNLSWLASMSATEIKDRGLDKLIKLYHEKFDEKSPITVGINSQQIINFVSRFQIGDIVVVRDPHRKLIHIVEVQGNYAYKEYWQDDCPYSHRKKIGRLRKISREELSEGLRSSLNSKLTIFSLKPHEDEIRTLLIDSKNGNKEITGKSLKRELLDRLISLNPKEFEEFVGNLLETAGFKATVTKLVGDKGVDVIGLLEAEGLASIKLKVQVKRYGQNEKVGIDVVLKTRGTLAEGEQGAIVTTAQFTNQAKEEAERANTRQINLIDGDLLVDFILRHEKSLDQKYRDLLKLKLKPIPLEELYILENQ